MLAELVKAGKLPPVDKRLPADLLVVKPVHETGKYGGTWRRAFTGKADGENGNRIAAIDKLLFWDHTGTKYDAKTANELLDKIGLDKKDSEGFRVRTDNGQRLRLEIMAPGGAIVPFTPHVEMIAQHWKKIGVQADVKETERGLSFTRVAANEHQLISWSVSGSEHLLLYPDNTLPVLGTNSYAGPLFGKWFASGGSAGKKPSDPKILEMMDLFRAAPGMATEARYKAVQDIWKIVVDEQWLIGTVGISPAALGVRIVKNTVGNTPTRQANAQHARTPGSSHPSTFYFKS